MSSQTQLIHATSPDTGIGLCDHAASKACPRETACFLARRATQEEADVLVKAHEDLVAEVKFPRESLARFQNALYQSETDRKQLRDISTRCSAPVSSHGLSWLSYVSR